MYKRTVYTYAMGKLTELEYLRLSKPQQLLYRLTNLVTGIPGALSGLGKKITKGAGGALTGVKDGFVDMIRTFTEGHWQTKVSYVVMGFGSAARGQFLRGVFFFLFEVVFIIYMITSGAYWLGKFGSMGDVPPHMEYDPILDTNVRVPGDDSFKIMLYGLLTIFFIIAFLYTWRLNVKQNRIIEDILAQGKKVKSGKDDLRSLVDDQFHKTLLALPLTGILIFTVMPIIFMILVAFTNYDGAHDGYSNLFSWVGMENFNQIFGAGGGGLSYTFGEILSWTLMWAVFATFTNYFLGMVVALMINKKGIRFKKGWRGILVLTIAIPQFISLLYMARLFDINGLVNSLLMSWKIIAQPINFWGSTAWSRVLVIVINIWVGIPYLMLITTGILMNIPADLYESAKIDGANAWQQYMKITLPYMLFVTGPYLLTSFINNINNFNVIYLLTKTKPASPTLSVPGAGAPTDTDLLITWIFRMTTGADSNYKMAAVVGLLIFVVVAVLSLVVYNLIPSTRNEEDFS